MSKQSKTEQDLAMERAKVAQQTAYNAWIKQIVAETADNRIKIDWIKSKLDLEDYTETLKGHEVVEKELTKKIVDEVLKVLDVNKTVEMYTHFGLTEYLPKVNIPSQQLVTDESMVETTLTTNAE